MSGKISIQCSCARDCLVDVGLGTKDFCCPACGKKLFGFSATKGHVYVLSNPAMPGLLKIGSTERTVQERVAELNSTGVPVPFEIEAVFNSESPFLDEQKVHRVLGVKRLNGNREFFSVEVKVAVQYITECLGYVPSYLKNPNIDENELDRAVRLSGRAYFLSKVTRAKFVRVPPCDFSIDSDLREGREGDACNSETPLPYWMSEKALTIGQYIKIMGQKSTEAKCTISKSVSVAQDDRTPLMDRGVVSSKFFNYPLVWISADAADELCKKLTFKEHANGNLPREFKYILPTVVQWEYACCAGAVLEYYKPLRDVAWYSENSRFLTHSVGLKLPNKWGLFDMHGNVSEWCQDREKGTRWRRRVHCGGAYNSSKENCVASFRDSHDSNDCSSSIGLRMTIQQTK